MSPMHEEPRNVRGIRLLREFIDALGIDRPLISMKIEADCHNPARVTLEFYPRDEDGKLLAKVFETYELAPKGLQDAARRQY